MLKLQVHFVLLIVSCLCVHLSNCAVSFERANPNASPGTCISVTHKLTMKAGDEANIPGFCMKAMCTDKGSIVYNSCGTVMIPPNCRFIEPDLSLPYPGCCRQTFVCDDAPVQAA